MDITKFLCSALSAGFAEFITFPIDTAKTILQLKNKGQPFSLQKFVNSQGITGLYKGSHIAVSRQFYLGGIVYTSYTPIKNSLPFEGEYTNKILAGGISGGLGQFLSTPLDILKVNVQAQRINLINGKGVESNKVGDLIKNIYKQHGIHGFTRGWIPNVQRSAILNSVGLPVYDISKTKLINEFNWKDNTMTHVMCSAISGLAAVTFELPFDTVKTRIMTSKEHLTTVECFKSIIKKEGVKKLWSGFLPAYIRLGPWQITFFVVFEQLNKLNGTKI